MLYDGPRPDCLCVATLVHVLHVVLGCSPVEVVGIRALIVIACVAAHDFVACGQRSSACMRK